MNTQARTIPMPTASVSNCFFRKNFANERHRPIRNKTPLFEESFRAQRQTSNQPMFSPFLSIHPFSVAALHTSSWKSTYSRPGLESCSGSFPVSCSVCSAIRDTVEIHSLLRGRRSFHERTITCSPIQSRYRRLQRRALAGRR